MLRSRIDSETVGGLIWVVVMVVAVIINAAKKAAKKNGGSAAAQTAKPPAAEAQRVESKPARPKAHTPKKHTPMQPTVRAEHVHDIAGSLGDIHTEGYDPCHEDELSPAQDPAMAYRAAPPQAQSGLKLDFSGSGIVNAFVMNEILNRRTRR